MNKKALITGITGQDGAYLSKLLLEKGYEVFGAFRRTSELNTSKLEFLGIADRIKFAPLDLLEFTNIRRTLEKVRPDEVYNLGAQSFVAMSFEQPVFTADVTALGPLRVLEAIRDVNPAIKFYQASSSEMFGKVSEATQDEESSFYPRSPYAASKLFAHWITVNYRESYNLFACSGILFNHESPLRGLEFVTRKITHAAARIKLGKEQILRLGNLEARRDWGYAPEYVEAMWLMLQQEKPDDYVIATGETHTVREFAEYAFKEVGIDLKWQGSGRDSKGIDAATGKTVIEVAPEFYRPTEVETLNGNYSKAKNRLGWQPRTKFRDLVRVMALHDLEIAGRGL